MSELIIERHGFVTTFTINRPERKNSINSVVGDALYDGLTEFQASDQRVAVIAARGKHFSGGADIADVPPIWKEQPLLGVKIDKPVICAVNGDCIGAALVIALFCDLCVASENATFWYPEARVGMTGGIAATLATRIPHKLAMEMLLLARKVPARRAYEMGFVNEVVPEGQAFDAALAMAQELAAMAPLVHRIIKRFADATLPQSPAEASARAQNEVNVIKTSGDRAEGVGAFLEGRQPNFSSR